VLRRVRERQGPEELRDFGVERGEGVKEQEESGYCRGGRVVFFCSGADQDTGENATMCEVVR